MEYRGWTTCSWRGDDVERLLHGNMMIPVGDTDCNCCNGENSQRKMVGKWSSGECCQENARMQSCLIFGVFFQMALQTMHRSTHGGGGRT